MSSNRSSSPASTNPVGVLRHGWATLIVLPLMVSLLYVAPVTPLIVMLLGEHFGLSGGREAPWPWGPGLLMLVAYWMAVGLGSTRLREDAVSAILAAFSIVAVLIWFALEPAWDVMPLLRNPISLVGENGYLFVPLLLGLGYWIQGLRMGTSRSVLIPEALREAARNSLVLLAAVMLLAAVAGGDIGREGISAAFLALPILLVCSAGAVAAAEMSSTRRIAAQRNIAAPGWDRWARVFGGTVAAILVLTGIGAFMLGPGALELMVDGLAAAWQVLATIIYWIMYAIVFVIFYIVRAITWIINSLFGEVIAPMEMPAFETGGGPEQDALPEREEPEPWKYATLARWIMVMAIVWLMLLLILWMTRRRAVVEDDVALEVERTSVFSAALARKQLRDLFRRKPKPVPPRRLDLERDPGTVRESMLYLQVLAARQEVPREPHETPQDFTERLAEEWNGVEVPLRIIRERYERVRYGETEEDRRAVVEAWRAIWTARKDVPKPSSLYDLGSPDSIPRPG